MKTTSLKPCRRKPRAAESRISSNAASGMVMVPGKRMCAVGGDSFPSGTYARTGATSALPSAAAIRAERNFTRALCLPRTMWGPFCSVPPMGTMMVVLPAWVASRTSIHVSSSRKTGRGWEAVSAKALTAAQQRSRKRRAVRCMGTHDSPGGPRQWGNAWRDHASNTGRHDQNHPLRNPALRSPRSRVQDAEAGGVHALSRAATLLAAPSRRRFGELADRPASRMLPWMPPPHRGAPGAPLDPLRHRAAARAIGIEFAHCHLLGIRFLTEDFF